MVHLACPIVWDPESATRSLAFKPLLENEEINVLRSEAGDGMSELAVERLAVVESRLPSCTLHVGPPNWISKSTCNIFKFWEHFVINHAIHHSLSRTKLTIKKMNFKFLKNLKF